PDRRTLVAAKVWVSPYPIGVLIIHTNCSRGIRNAWHFCYALTLVFKVVGVRFGNALLTP
ncbi:hypothetical protein R7041_01935, partial [Vibrio sp. 1751]